MSHGNIAASFRFGQTDAGLRNTEQVRLLELGRHRCLYKREALPYTSDAWIDESATKIG